jgi:hypothetical protein
MSLASRTGVQDGRTFGTIIVPDSPSLTVAGLAETLFSAAVSQRKNTFTEPVL